MKAKQLRWLFIGLLTALPTVVLFVGIGSEPFSIGVSAEWSNDRYRFAGGTQPWALIFAALIIGLYLLLMYAPPSRPGKPLPGVLRRFVAFWLDFVLAIMAVSPILGSVPTLTEWRRTGVFAWTFERTYRASGDESLITTVFLLTSLVLVFYYALPLVRRRPSPGTCIAEYQIVAEDGVGLTLPKALLRTLLGLIALCVAYLAPFVLRDRKNGKFWLDKVFRTQAVTLT